MKKSELEDLEKKINNALESRGKGTRVMLRGAYGKVGLYRTHKDRPNEAQRELTPLMTRKELGAYMLAALDGIWLFE